jgi:predicted  nucleic acid-binding Zn-ribbon protein
MSPDTLRFILQVVAITLGGGTVQLAIFLLRRRGELRNLSVNTDATALGSANEYVKTLQDADKALRAEIAELKTEIRRMQNEWNAERSVATDALTNSTREVERSHAELARTKADLVVAQAQISELGGRMPGRHRGPLSSDYDWRRGP